MIAGSGANGGAVGVNWNNVSWAWEGVQRRGCSLGAEAADQQCLRNSRKRHACGCATSPIPELI